MEGRDPNGNDECYLACIKRANLDAMTGKSPLRIGAHLRETVMVINNAALVNKTPSYQPRGPFPLMDIVGMGLAVDMLVKSLVSKGHIESHVQFSTLRRLRATHTKNWESSPLGGGVKEPRLPKALYASVLHPVLPSRSGSTISCGEWSIKWDLNPSLIMDYSLGQLSTSWIS